MRKVKGNIRKMLAAIVLTLLCCSAFAQRIVESGDLRTTTDEQHGTVVHYLKGGKRPLSGKFRILRGHFVRWTLWNGRRIWSFKIYRNMKKVITASGKCYGYNVQDKCAIYFE